MYSRGETVAFEYGRRAAADSKADYVHINQGTREDLKEVADDLYKQVKALFSSDDLNFER